MQGALIVAQVAVSVVLLVGAGLLLASFYRLQSVDPGYKRDGVLSAELFTQLLEVPERRHAAALLSAAGRAPRVTARRRVGGGDQRRAAAWRRSPGRPRFQIEGRIVDDPNRRPTADMRIVSANFFGTLGVPLVSGRVFTRARRPETQRVVVINEAMMRYWDRTDPVGSRISLDNGQTWSTIVGIVGDVKQFGLDQPAVAQVYMPLPQAPQGLGGQVLVRTTGDPASAAALIRDAACGDRSEHAGRERADARRDSRDASSPRRS